MVLNAAVQLLREAEELKQKILKYNSCISMLQDRSLWITQQQLQKVYQKVLVLDLDYALEKKVEQDLWNVGFKQQIEALQAISKDRKSVLRNEAQGMLSWVLQAAAGFYLCLLHQICTTFKLDLPFRRRASLLGSVEGWEAGGCPEPVRAGAGAARYACQHCLVHLGDLARYRHQLKVAHTFYRHALAVSVHSGQPYNQLALVAWRRGRRLAALYWHVRSLLVRAPFPPAPANLARTLAAAGRDVKESPLPVLPGLSSVEGHTTSTPSKTTVTEKLDSHSYVNELVRTLHYLHSLEHLDKAEELVEKLNSSLTHLVATDSFDSMTLVKMACVTIWLVHSSTEDLSLEPAAMSEAEGRAAVLAGSLAAHSVLALLLAAHTGDTPNKGLPALRVWLQWSWCRQAALRSHAWGSRPHMWAALAHALNNMGDALEDPAYESLPLPEDEELHGFLPLEEALKGLKFPNHCGWDSNKLPQEEPDEDTASSVSASWGASYLALVSDTELQARVRSARLRRLGEKLAEQHPELLTCDVDEDGVMSFSTSESSKEQLSLVLATLTPPSAPPTEPQAPPPVPPPPPLIISEADFREKVREKRAGILKPQGSLERAREERRAAPAAEDQDGEECEEGSKSEDKKEARKPRVNIAMAAIMRKQEETNKQVKFVTPPPTPETTDEASESASKDEKTKVIQPKAIKSLANLPVGRKTGGILSLKDKSAGYPHLQNTETETKKSEQEEKSEEKSAQNSSVSQNYHQRDQGTNWPTMTAPYSDNNKMNFQKNYGIQNSGISYNPNYQAPSNTQGIRLPVVNPKEIDVRTAALQKQNSRQEIFQEANKFNHGYQISGDKKNFLNDLPPRFANQYRYWQSPHENTFNDNKFRDDSNKLTAPFTAQPPRQNWPSTNDNFQQGMPWWKPDTRTNFNQPNFSTTPMNIPNFYSQMSGNVPNIYPNLQYNQMQGQNIGQNMQNVGQNMSNIGRNKQDSLAPSFGQSAVGQPQVQPLGLVSSPGYSSAVNSFSPYPAAVSYDSSLYPQFNKLGYQPLQLNKQNYHGKDSEPGVGFGSNVLDVQHVNYNEPFTNDGTNDTLEDVAGAQSEAGAAVSGGVSNTYSLFRQDAHAWPPSTHQSLWSGPGGSPLERLLEQQKQMKPPSTH
ncbi:unnamed protein product [Danaus chrysippus]|uniref:(African queen) hypothetical protein n=1 Tax=Danaus chrysippus TaxID=151541 RepID=A0A8J2RA30_9NEOP|nr:unnamed protein product [Danaus chrysippus]